MKDDTISRQAAIDTIENIVSNMSVCINSDECHGMKRMQKQAVIELTNLLPTQPEQNLGKWVDDGDPLSWVCSECGYRVARYNNTPYCPNCGAKMIDTRGGQDD